MWVERKKEQKRDNWRRKMSANEENDTFRKKRKEEERIRWTKNLLHSSSPLSISSSSIFHFRIGYSKLDWIQGQGTKEKSEQYERDRTYTSTMTRVPSFSLDEWSYFIFVKETPSASLSIHSSQQISSPPPIVLIKIFFFLHPVLIHAFLHNPSLYRTIFF